jgi:hypothetical protein
LDYQVCNNIVTNKKEGGFSDDGGFFFYFVYDKNLVGFVDYTPIIILVSIINAIIIM